MNRLAKEKSPYLLQHQNNPVDWYPWGEEAFEKARREDKPIFLSIGYSTCHWCHVMEHESFENPGIAKILNEFFVSIKVDREERPDIDAVYMKAVMALTGQGGWPLSAFLTPDLKPFYGGTYFPPEDKWGRAGFMTVLTQLHHKWVNQRQVILGAGKQLMDILNSSPQGQAVSQPLDLEVLIRKAGERFTQLFDPEDGGFGSSPKFPRTHALDLLLRSEPLTDETRSMLELTLQKMATGGIYDHLGGGFHRYSVDSYWFVPHFEKMLYDQALISKTYLEMFSVTKNPFYAATARSVFHYVLRDLSSPEGAFFSAEDADSLDPETDHKSEGAFYIWSEAEIRALLDSEEADLFCWAYGVQPNGNVKEDPHQEFTGKNILFRAYTAYELSARFRKSAQECETILSRAKQKLFEKREKRSRPHRDEKILTDWNALMIESLALGGRLLSEPQWTESAEKAFSFLKNKMKRADGRWMHRYADGETAVPGFLDDYVFLAKACHQLYQATWKTEYLREAYFLTEETERLFYDEKQGGFFLAAQDSEKLIARSKDLYDGAIPSGNSIAIQVFVTMGTLFGKTEWIDIAQKTAQFFSGSLGHDPSGFPAAVTGLMARHLKEVFIVGEKDQDEIRVMLSLASRYSLNTFWIFKPDGADDWLDSVMSASAERKGKPGAATAYVCQNQTCSVPVESSSELERLLE